MSVVLEILFSNYSEILLFRLLRHFGFTQCGPIRRLWAVVFYEWIIWLVVRITTFILWRGGIFLYNYIHVWCRAYCPPYCFLPEWLCSQCHGFQTRSLFSLMCMLNMQPPHYIEIFSCSSSYRICSCDFREVFTCSNLNCSMRYWMFWWSSSKILGLKENYEK